MRRARDRARRAAQTAEGRDARLRQIRENRRQSLATESEEERAGRLQQMSANQCHRLATETEEERAARLQQMSANQRHRLASETEEERAARLYTAGECQPIITGWPLKLKKREQPDHLILPFSCPPHPSTPAGQSQWLC